MRGPDYGLRIYPKHPVADAYKVGGAFEPYAIVGVDKRFTDAELAAEYWECRYDSEVSSSWASDYSIIKRSEERLEIMGRFARLPHYDD